jgi:CRP-like cAMP-binding protein
VVKVRVGGGVVNPSISEFLKRFQAGTVIFREGELGSEMFIIQSGQVMISRSVGGQQRELAVLEKGDFFGEMALLDENPERSATATAISDVEALQMRSADLDSMLRRKPDIAIRMMMKLADRLRETNRKYEELVGKSAEAANLTGAPANQGIMAWALLTHEASGVFFPINPTGETTLGRHDPVTGVTPDIDLSGLDPERTVSRRHAMIRAGERSLALTETNPSSNGTFVNGKKLAGFEPHPIVHGDIVQLALVAMRVHVLPGGE